MGITHTLIRRFWVAYDQGDHEYMFLLLDEAEIRAHEAGDLVMSGWALCNHGQIAWRVYTNLTQAYEYFERSLKVFNEAHFPVGVRHAVINLAEVQPNLLTVENAQVLNEAALRWLREIAPGHRNTGFILTMLAETAAVRGQLERAARLLGAASRLNFEGYTPEAIARFNKNVAHICTLLGETAFDDAWAAGSSMSFTETVAYAVESGADFASISAPASITAYSTGESPLTRRELEVLHLIAAGITNREIAAQLILAPSTIKWYVNEIFSKLYVTNRAQAVARAQTLGLLP
jgi:ATP/maltotriose-dependent transcriptional regulator MalT